MHIQESKLAIWRISPRYDPIQKAETLAQDKPILIYSGGQNDWIERGSDEDLKQLLYSLITNEQGVAADCDMYVLAMENAEKITDKKQKLAFFDRHADALAAQLAEKLTPDGSNPETLVHTLTHVTFFGFSRGCGFADKVAEHVEKRLKECFGLSPEAAGKAVGDMAAIYTAYSPFDEKLAFKSHMPTAIFMDMNDWFVRPQLERMGIDKKTAPLLKLEKKGSRYFIVGNGPDYILRAVGYHRDRSVFEKSRSLVDGHNLYMDTNITHDIPDLDIRTFQVRPYAHILREMLDAQLGGAHSFPSRRGDDDTPESVINRVALHYLRPDNVARTEEIMKTGQDEYKKLSKQFYGRHIS